MAGTLKAYLRKNTNLIEADIEKVVMCFKLKVFNRGTILLSQGEVCRDLYFINRGCIRTYYLTKQGHEKTRYIAFNGSVATVISSFITQLPSFEFADVLEKSEVYVISHADFYHLTRTLPAWASFYQTLLEMAYVYQNKKIEDLVTLSAKERYEMLLKEWPVYIQRLSNKILASYLNIREESLSRIKSK
jgi:CRP-like cAMP-binding protein